MVFVPLCFSNSFFSSSSRVLQTLAGCNYNLGDLPLMQRGEARVDERKQTICPPYNSFVSPDLPLLPGHVQAFVLFICSNKHKLITQHWHEVKIFETCCQLSLIVLQLAPLLPGKIV